MTDSFWTLKLSDFINFAILIVTILAIIYGPIRAVEITRRKDLERDADARKRRILAALMSTRKMSMHPDHVGALNQVQLEFFGNQQVMDAYRAYIANLSETVPQPGNDLQNFLNRRNDRFFDLLYTMAVATDVMIDRHELERLAYLPFGWQAEQDGLQALRTAMLAVLEGRRPLLVVSASPGSATQPQQSPYPPPPA